PPRSAAPVLVWRKQNQVFYRDIDPIDHAGLVALTGSCTFAKLCDVIADALPDSADVAAEINRRFQKWLNDGILIRLTAGEKRTRRPRKLRGRTAGGRSR